MDTETCRLLTRMQKNELTEHLIYTKIAGRLADGKNRNILQEVARDEYRHYEYLKKLTGADVQPDRLRILFYCTVTIVFGLSFGLKLMEKGEVVASEIYSRLSGSCEGAGALSIDEQRHENELLNLLSEERLEYAGSVVLGLNDALVELTGALAGLTFALQNSRLIALAGLVTGFAASLSMAASGYLSSREEAGSDGTKNPLKAAMYTGIAYVTTVMLLIAPYFIFTGVFAAFSATMLTAMCIIFLYTFYITTAKGLPFWHRFGEMAAISLTIALISFGIGIVLKRFLGVDM